MSTQNWTFFCGHIPVSAASTAEVAGRLNMQTLAPPTSCGRISSNRGRTPTPCLTRATGGGVLVLLREGRSTMRRPTWELGTRLMIEVQAQDLKAARTSLRHLLDVIAAESGPDGFDELKLRTFQALTNVNRAAYHAGASPDRLFDVNARLIDEVIKVKTVRQLRALAGRLMTGAIAAIPERDHVASQRLGKAVSYIQSHCTEPITRDRVAEVAGCSPSHLSVLFSTVMGQTYKSVVLKYRMERAKDLLRQRDRTVTEIAFEVGYKDPGYFATAFKRITGITPGQYRKKMP